MHLDNETLTLLALGEASNVAQARSHLDSCAQCLTELGDLRRTVRLAREGGRVPDEPFAAPPARVWEAIATELALPSAQPTGSRPADARTRAAEERAHAERRVTGARGAGPSRAVMTVTPRPGGDRLRRRRLIGVLAVVALLAVGLGAAVRLRSVGSPAVLNRGVLTSPRGDVAQGGPTGSAEVLSTSAGHELRVHASHLPLRQGFYEVWLLDPDNGQMVSIGVLGDREAGVYPLPPGLDLSKYPVVDVSAEQYDGNPAHSATSVLRGPLRT